MLPVRLPEIIREKMRITDLSRATGATVDELRYMERKGFIKPARARLKQRKVRDYKDGEIKKAQLVIKYRRQGFTWDTAFQKAIRELENPPLFGEK